MMKTPFLLLSLVALSLGLGCTHAPRREPAQALNSVQAVCGSGRQGSQSYSWCVQSEPKPRSGTVLYYFHGNGGNESSWNTPEHQKLVSLWGKQASAPSAIVSISFGKNWFLNQNLQEVVARKIIPDIESRLGFAVKRRVLLGESMGGFNAAVMALASPKVFDRIAISCPAVYPINPYASTREVSQFVARQPAGVNTKFILKWLGKQQSYFRSAQEFSALDPIRMPEKLSSSNTAFYMMGDENDSLGVYEGAKLMAGAAKKRGLNVQWWSIPNADHCQHSGPSLEALAKFLAAE
ncbi:MAG: alpha/beta fold hydrolase [Bdellovibrio sp.]